MIRHGQVMGHRTFYPALPKQTSLATALVEFLPQYYLNPIHQQSQLSRIVLSTTVEDKAWLQSALQEILQQPVKLIAGVHSYYQSWCELAKRNTLNELKLRLHTHNQFTDKLNALQKALDIPYDLQRIECFDISHTAGELAVASCVVFGRNGAEKSLYRRFNIKNITPGDDYAAMRQALLRRYTRLKKQDAQMPELIIIDGGKGQLKQAVEVLEEIQLSGILLLGIAKGPSRKPGCESLYLHGNNSEIELAHDTPALHCLQIIRDEAHRFAITTHRKRRVKKALESVLERIPGVGPKRRQQLLSHFGGLQALQKASIEDISKVPGLSIALAEIIYTHLHA